MKTKTNARIILLCIIIWISPQLLHSQFVPQEVEIYQTGTKLVYYLGQCGEEIAGTEGKLTFCDKKGSFGVVETSFGLNSNKVTTMADNYYNEDEVYVTTNGMSQRKSDGSWQNFPEFALARDSGNNPTTNVTNALLDDQGRLFYNGSNNYSLNWVDVNTLQRGALDLPGTNYYTANKFAYNPDSGLLYFSIKRSGQGADALVFKNSNEEIEFIEVPTGTNRIYKLLYRNNLLYILGNQGLHSYNPGSGQIIEIVAAEAMTSNPNYLKDMAFETDQNLWISVIGNSNDRKIVIANVDSNSIEAELVLPPPSGQVNLAPHFMSMDINGQMWVTVTGISGILSINPSDLEITYHSMADLESLGFELSYSPDDVHTQNGKTYLFCGTNSTTLNQHSEVLVYDGTNWTDRSDDEPGNISTAFSRRFTQSEASEDGVWWSSSYDNGVISFIGYNDERKVLYNQNLGSNGRQLAIDTDNKPVFYGGSNPHHHLKKIYYPQTIDLDQGISYNHQDVLRYKDQIWVWQGDKKIKTYKENQHTGTYDLSELQGSYYAMGADILGRAYFSRFISSANLIELHQYDMATGTLTTYTHTPGGTVGSLSTFTPLPDGGILALYTRRLIYFKDGNFIDLTPDDANSTQNMYDAVADTDGNLYIIRYDRDLIKIADFPNNHTAEYIVLESPYGGNLGIVPEINLYRPNSVTIDTFGKFWVHGSNNFMRIKMDDSPVPFTLSDGETFGVKGRVFLDKNENETYDSGEGFGNQRVTLVVNGEEKFTTYTNVEGEYSFNYYQLGVPYDIVLPSLAPNTTTDARFQTITPTQNDQDFWAEDFMLKPMFVSGLLVKDGKKTGAFAMERAGLENVFTAAIGNVSYTRSYHTIDLKYTFKAETDDENVELPGIADAKIFRVTPLNNACPIFDLTINPNNNSWNLPGMISGIDYTIEELNYEFTQEILAGETNLEVTIPLISPLDVYIVEIETELFDPQFTGISVVYGFSRAASPDLGGTESNPEPREFTLIPRDHDNPYLGSPVEFNPYIHPDDIEEEVPFTEPKDFYVPPPRQTVIRSSWDPNDKMISPGLDDVLNEQDINEKWLLYTIRFENVGNFSAKDISILDELDEKLDPHTLTLMETSHSVQLHQIEVDGEIYMKFDFNDIYLDYTSNNPEESHGWLSFYIKAKESVQVDDIVENTASIYFDQNPPIVTNTVQTKFVNTPLGVGEVTALPNLLIYPNPVKEVVHIETIDIVQEIRLISMTGKLLKSQKGKDYLQVNDIPSGIYIILVTTDKGSQAKKLIINHNVR
ncbi:MAG: T9SS type A sorting domain-containing protein [Flavobacteriaceae bacterium]|nr:T9SS type A sorting domain-containing protein [Flavobacteriaceae bacterium]